MDPLSITASVVGLTATCVQTAKAVSDLRGKYRDAPATLATICTEITIISASLSQLQNVILRDPQALVSKLSERVDLENTFDAALMGCFTVFDNLQVEIQKVKGDEDPDATDMGFRAKMRWLWSDGSIKDVLGQLRGIQTALTLLLQLLGTESVYELRQMIEGNTVVLEKVVEQTMRIRSVHKARRLPESITDMTFETYSITSSDDSSTLLGREFTFDDQIVNSNAYRRALFKMGAKASASAEKAMLQGSGDDQPKPTTIQRPDSPSSNNVSTATTAMAITQETTARSGQIVRENGPDMTVDEFVWRIDEAKPEFTDWADYWRLKREDVSDKSKHQIEMQCILMEVLESEEYFINGLLSFKYLFVYQTALIKGLATFAREVFGDVDRIIKLHRTHLYEPLRTWILEQGPWAKVNWEIFTDFFITARDEYLLYADSFPLRVHRVDSEAEQNPSLRSLLESCHAHPLAKRLQWQVYMKSPLTRLMRYGLFMQTLRKFMGRMSSSTEMYDFDVAGSAKTVETIREINFAVDSRIEIAQRKVKSLIWQKRLDLDGTALRSNREIVLEAVVRRATIGLRIGSRGPRVEGTVHLLLTGPKTPVTVDPRYNSYFYLVKEVLARSAQGKGTSYEIVHKGWATTPATKHGPGPWFAVHADCPRMQAADEETRDEIVESWNEAIGFGNGTNLTT